MAESSSSSNATLSLGVDTTAAIASTKALHAELLKLKQVSEVLSAKGIDVSESVQSFRTLQAEATSVARDMGTAGASAGQKFSASFSQTMRDGVRVSMRGTNTDVIALTKQMSEAQVQAQQTIRSEYGKTQIERERMERADIEGWKARTAAANRSASEVAAIEAKAQAQREALDELAHAQRVTDYREQVELARRTQAQIEAIDEAAYAKRVARNQARISGNESLMGRGGIGNRLLTGTSSMDLAALELLGNQYRQLEAETNKQPAAQARMANAMRGSTGVMADAHAAARGLSGSLGQLWVTYGNIAPLVAFAAIGASMRQTFTIGKDLEFQLKFVSIVAEDAAINTGAFFDTVGQSIKPAREAAEGLRMLAQSGLSTGQAMSVLPEVLNLATIGEITVKEAALAATGAMQAFNLEVSDFERIGDVYAKASALSNASVQDITESMRQASTVADFYNITLEQTAASLAIMAKANIVGSAGGTAFRNAMKELYTPTDKAKTAMQQVGLELFDANGKMKDFTQTIQDLRQVTSQMNEESKLAFLNDVFGERGAKAINAILSNYTQYTETLKELQEANGFVMRGVAELQDTVEGASIRMKNALNQSFFEAFEDSSESVRETVDGLADAFASPEFKDALVTLAELASALTITLAENADTFVLLVELYLGTRLFSAITQGFKSGALAVAGYTANLKELALQKTLLSATGTRQLAMTAATTVGTEAVAMSTAKWAGRLSMVSRWLGPVGIGVAAAATGYQIYAQMQDNTSNSTDGFMERSRRVTRTLEMENDRLEKNIQKLREKAGLEGQAPKGSVVSNFVESLEAEKTAKAEVARLRADSFASKDDRKKAEAKLKGIVDERYKQTAIENNRQRNQATLNYENTRSGLLGNADSLLETAKNGTKGAQAYVKEIEGWQKVLKLSGVNTDAVKAALEDLNKKVNKAQSGSYAGASEGNSPSAKRAAAEAKRLARQQENDLRRETQAELASIDRSWANVNAADQQGFEFFKQSVNQSVSSGALSQGAAAVMIEERNKALAKALDLNTFIQIQAIKDEEKEKGSVLDEASILRLKTARESLEAELSLRKAKYEQDSNLAAQAVRETEKADAKKLEKDRAKLEEQASLNNALSERTFSRRFVTDPVELAGQAAYESVFQANASAVQRYADQLELAKVELQDLKSASDITQASLDAQARTVDLAEDRYQAMLAVQEKLALQAQDLAESQQLVANSFDEGANRAFASYIRSAGTAADQTERLFTNAFGKATDELVSFTKTGKLDFKSFAASVIDDLIRIETQRALTGIFKQTLGFGGSGAVDDFVQANTGQEIGGGFLAEIGNFVSGLFADGAAFEGGVQAFAKGGAFTNNVFNAPTAFKFARGGGFANGVMGEAGPEAVMPLKRDGQGRLGVAVNGGSSGATNMITNTVNVTVQGGQDPDETGDIVSNKVLTAMRSIADQQIANSMRPNGMLNRVTS